MSAYEIIKVEGPDDQQTFDQLFAVKGRFEAAGNKRKVRQEINKNTQYCGIIDRDFASDEEVHQSREEGSRCILLRRYALENYLLEPRYLYRFACNFHFSDHQDWCSEQAIEQLIIRKGQELCHYTAANALLHQIARDINFQQLTPYFDEYPVIEEDEVRQELRQRFDRLPTSETVGSFLEQWENQAREVREACHTLEGVNRWINGKVLLRDVIYREIVSAQPAFSQRSKKVFVQRLTDVAKEEPPVELVDILNRFGLMII